MALNAARNGHRYPEYLYEVGREKVREYADATFLLDQGDEGGSHGADLAAVPPTFAACVTGAVIPMVVDDPELGGHWNLLHTAQSFEFLRPMRVGDALRCCPRIADIASRRSMDLLTIAVDVTDASSDEPVFTASSTLVFFAAEQH